jgi:hypothetical protein
MWEFKFNKDSLAWTKYDEMNRRFINQQIVYLDDVCKHYGYLYLNRIYESFGVVWDHERYNHCLTHERGFNLSYEVVGECEYLIHITI